MRFRTGGFLAILAAAALLWGPRASAATEPAGATGSAFGVSVTSSLLGTLQAPIPGGASGSVTDPGTHFGPLQVTTGVTGVSGVLEAARLDAEAGGTIVADAPQASSRAEVQGLSVAGILVAADLSSTCEANPVASSGSVHLGALKLGGTAVPVTPAPPNTVVDVPAMAHIVLNEQLPLDAPGGSGIVVRAMHLELLPTSPGAATLDVVIAESRCSATGSPVAPSTRPAGTAVRRSAAAGAVSTPNPALATPSVLPSTNPATAPTETPPGGPQVAPGAGPASPATPPAAGQESLTISPAGGPPGADIVLSGAGYAGCREVAISFDGTALAAVPSDSSGRFRGSRIAVPGDASPGSHTIGASCISGVRLERSTSFRVVTAALHRSEFVTSLRAPSQVPVGVVAVAIGVVAAVSAVPLVAFPSKLFNNTLRDNYAQVRGWFGLPPQPSGRLLSRHQVLFFCASVLVGGVLDGLLSPDFGANLSTLALVLGLATSLVVITFVFRLPLLLLMRTRYGEWGSLRVFPGTVLVAAACVVLSRLVHFEPGYVYGLIAGPTFSRHLRKDTTGRLTLLAAVSLLGVGIVAWIARTPLVAAAARPHAGFAVIAVEACLAAVFVVGLESVLFCLVPLRFLEGEKLTAWNRGAWAAIFSVAAFAFVEILLQPTSGFLARSSSPKQALVSLVLFVGFGAFSVAFWAYFRFSPDAGSADGSGRPRPADAIRAS